MNIFEDSDNSYDWRRIDAFAQRLVVEADISAGDWGFQLLAGSGHSVDRLGELPHDVRFLRIAKVQAVGRSNRRRARTGDVARRLSHRMHGAQLGIEVTPPTVAIESHRQPAIPPLHADHAGFAAGTFDGVGLNHRVVL